MELKLKKTDFTADDVGTASYYLKCRDTMLYNAQLCEQWGLTASPGMYLKQAAEDEWRRRTALRAERGGSCEEHE